MSNNNVARVKPARVATERLSTQLGRIDAAVQVIQLYEQSRPEGVPALTLAARELDEIRDEIERAAMGR